MNNKYTETISEVVSNDISIETAAEKWGVSEDGIRASCEVFEKSGVKAVSLRLGIGSELRRHADWYFDSTVVFLGVASLILVFGSVSFALEERLPDGALLFDLRHLTSIAAGSVILGGFLKYRWNGRLDRKSSHRELLRFSILNSRVTILTLMNFTVTFLLATVLIASVFYLVKLLGVYVDETDQLAVGIVTGVYGMAMFFVEVYGFSHVYRVAYDLDLHEDREAERCDVDFIGCFITYLDFAIAPSSGTQESVLVSQSLLKRDTSEVSFSGRFPVPVGSELRRNQGLFTDEMDPASQTLLSDARHSNKPVSVKVQVVLDAAKEKRLKEGDRAKLRDISNYFAELHLTPDLRDGQGKWIFVRSSSESRKMSRKRISLYSKLGASIVDCSRKHSIANRVA